VIPVPNSWLDQALDRAADDNRPLVGVALARVADNLDATGQGRVQLELPWLPDVRPWARVVLPGAGARRGLYSIPQPGDEVLVAFEQGDVAQPYVLGGLWSVKDPTPAAGPQAPVTNRTLRTPLGHVLDFDDLKQTVTLTTTTGQAVELTPESIRVTTTGEAASIELDTTGSVTIRAAVSITLNAPQLEFSGGSIQVNGDASVQIQGGATCTIQAGLVSIN
jgi:uncharacterized protein involved in type VI secretion and phage assembly